MTDEISAATLKEFLSGAESLRREHVRYVLSSAGNVRNLAQTLTLTEAYVAFAHELNTFQRGSVLTRLRQRIRQRSGEVIDAYLKTFEEGVAQDD